MATRYPSSKPRRKEKASHPSPTSSGHEEGEGGEVETSQHAWYMLGAYRGCAFLPLHPPPPRAVTQRDLPLLRGVAPAPGRPELAVKVKLAIHGKCSSSPCLPVCRVLRLLLLVFAAGSFFFRVAVTVQGRYLQETEGKGLVCVLPHQTMGNTQWGAPAIKFPNFPEQAAAFCPPSFPPEWQTTTVAPPFLRCVCILSAPPSS